MDRQGYITGAALVFAIASCLVLATPAHADPGPSPSPSPTPTPSLPILPTAIGATGDYRIAFGTIQNPQYQDGYYIAYPSNGQVIGQTTYFGGGDYHPVNSPDHLTLTVNGQYTSLTLQPAGNPLDSVLAISSATPPQDPVFSTFGLAAHADILLTSLVKLTAKDQTAYDALLPLLGTNGGIASITGKYYVTGTGSALAGVGAFTGLNTLDPSLQQSFSVSCSPIGYSGDPASCAAPSDGMSAYQIGLNFVPGSLYADGDALSFYSQIELGANAESGPFGTYYAQGTAHAYIDPSIVFTSDIDLGDYTLNVGGQSAALVGAPAPGGVPEPATWGLLLLGFGAAGAALRRRQAAGVRSAAHA